MKPGISCRNQWEGTVSAIRAGAVNTEVTLKLAGGDQLSAIITEESARNLGLAVGKPAVALVKAPWVMVQAGKPTLRLSARNQLAGKVSKLQRGAVNSEVEITLAGGCAVVAIVTNDAADALGLKVGEAATALVKASHVVLGVPL